uniref:C-type lectin domain-containing protein n=2 Tax=Caenorhabditis tropicalis TaxID=1561998 RepID=A0A1I7SZ38_9PELO
MISIMRLLLLSLLGITVASGIILSGRGFGGGGRGRGSSSYSYSSEEHHGGRPHRPPRPPRGPRDPICDTEWLMFRRPSGIWCVKIFYGPGTKYTADNLCQAQGAVLSSLQNANERMQIASEA